MKFIYKVVDIELDLKAFSRAAINSGHIEEIANDYGMEGWELVSVVPNTGNGHVYSHTLYFKKEEK